MTTNLAYLLPVERTMGRLIEWDDPDELEALMLGLLGAERVTASPQLRTPFGPILLWSAYPPLTGLPADAPQPDVENMNFLAMFVAEISGGKAVYFGDVIVTGAETRRVEETFERLPADLSIRHIEALISMAADRAETGEDPSTRLILDMLQAIRRRNVPAIYAALARYGSVAPGSAEVLHDLLKRLGPV